LIFLRFLILSLALLVASAQTQRLATFYDPSVRQTEFAASEIAKAGAGAAPNFAFEEYADAPCSPCVIIAASPAQTARLVADLRVAGLRSDKRNLTPSPVLLETAATSLPSWRPIPSAQCTAGLTSRRGYA
jgi:hypothetical protein